MSSIKGDATTIIEICDNVLRGDEYLDDSIIKEIRELAQEIRSEI